MWSLQGWRWRTAWAGWGASSSVTIGVFRLIRGLVSPSQRGYPATTVSNIEALGISVDPALVEKYGQVLPVHPTQLYEVGISTAVFFFLWKIRRHKHSAGWLFMLWLGFAGAERFLVEFLRAKDDRFFGVLTLAQIISLGIIGVGIYGMTKLNRPAEAAA